jgi:CDP-4-dehydro-6-deoxyglucose reductase
MPWKWYDGEVVGIEDMNDTTKKFWVKTEEKMDFDAGQFVTMDLPISDKRLKRWRSYSIANIPNEDKLLEFCIVKLEGGAATEFLFNKIEKGQTIKFKGPSGAFILPKQMDHPMVMICTGTGVAPFRSMLMEIKEKKLKHPPIHLIFGTRYKDGILYRTELEGLASDVENFQYDIVLSREPNWNGYKGYVHQVYLEKYRNNHEGVHFYFCGWTRMIDEGIAHLINDLNVDKSNIHYELYG